MMLNSLFKTAFAKLGGYPFFRWLKLLPIAEPAHDAGVIYYNGARFYACEEGVVFRPISMASDVKVTDTVVANTIVETDLYTVAIQPETQGGKFYRIPLYGVVSCANAVDTITFRFRVDGSFLTRAITTKVVAGAPWHNDMTLILRTCGVAGTFSSFAHMDFNDESDDVIPINGNIDTTTPINIRITVQWSNARPGNTLTCMGGILEDMN